MFDHYRDKLEEPGKLPGTGCPDIADLIDVKGPDGRWRVYLYDELVDRKEASLNSFWLRGEGPADSDDLLAPELIAQKIVDDIQAALEKFRLIAANLNCNGGAATNG